MTPDVLLHQQMRRPAATATLLGVVALVILSAPLPAARAVWQVEPLVLQLATGACFVVSACAAAAYRWFGQGSAGYARANAAETATFATAMSVVIAASGHAGSAMWFLYFVHLVHSGMAGFQRRFNGSLYALLAAGLTLWFALTSEWGATLLVLILGLFSLYTYFTLSGTAVRLRETTLQRDALEQQLTTLRIEEERQRIARDLHDGVGSDLAALHWQLEALRAALPSDAETEGSFALLHERLSRGSGELRNVVWELRAGELRWNELISHLQSRCAELVPAHMSLAFEARGETAVALDPTLHVQVARFVQEGVRNAVRHSGGKQVRVELELASDLRVAISDDGSGIRAERRSLRQGGLRNLEQRMASCGGRFDIVELQPGTRLSAHIPL
ncbi:MAG TPA: histidine kinase [Polyangiaceae bacterium]|nr:histidine kinase [Polyangiaceae bacterium]